MLAHQCLNHNLLPPTGTTRSGMPTPLQSHRRSLLKQPALSAGHRHLYDYPTPSHLNVLWEFGSLGGIGLHVQIVTGIVLAMHYTPHVVCAAVSIEHILREVYAGHVLRHAHANGASLFFIAV